MRWIWIGCWRKRMNGRSNEPPGAARVQPGDIRRLAGVYREASPAVIRVGWGLERNTNGAQAMSAILAIPALLGKFGVRGGGYTLSNSGAES